MPRMAMVSFCNGYSIVALLLICARGIVPGERTVPSTAQSVLPISRKAIAIAARLENNLTTSDSMSGIALTSISAAASVVGHAHKKGNAQVDDISISRFTCMNLRDNVPEN